MAARKPDSEVGPLGVWAYDTARDLGLSAAQVAARLEVHEATIRKIEGGSNKTPSARMVGAIHRYFQEVAAAKGKVALPPPNGWLDSKPPPADQAALVTALQAQTDALKDLVDELRQWRTEDRDRLAAVERTAEQLVARLLPVSEDGGSLERHVHGRTKE